MESNTRMSEVDLTYTKLLQSDEKSHISGSSGPSGPKKFVKSISKGMRTVLIAVIAAVALMGLFALFTAFREKDTKVDKVDVQAARKTEDINKELNVPLKDAQGTEMGKVVIILEKAELRDEILVQGRKGRAVEGRTFLIINLKITNELKQPVEMKTRDYIRLSLNGNQNEWLAPDIHNDPVQIQAESTKYTRVAFPIYETDRQLELRVGEINGDKQNIPLTIQ